MNDRINSTIDTPLIRAKSNYAKDKYNESERKEEARTIMNMVVRQNEIKYQHTTLERHEATPLRVEASRTIHPTNREEE